VFRARACEVQIGTKRPVLVEADGDVIGTTPLSFTINPGALAVLVPKQ
jgi:diacylglycerol kinase family enzyme